MTIHRRRLLASIGLGLPAACLLSACRADDVEGVGTTSAEARTGVIVIGAGISGLAAARHLADQGEDVLVLEARDRIGGRIWTSDDWDGAPVDLGASWIHGVEKNPITELAAKAKAKTVVTDLESTTDYLPDGQEAEGARAEKIEQWRERTAGALGTYREEQDRDAPMRSVVERSLRFSALPDGDKAMVNNALNDYEHEYSGSTTQMSTLYFDSDSAFDGDDVLFPGGYGQITDYLARGLDIRLGQQVKNIDWNSSGVAVRTDKASFQASQVVVTLPLGVLQSGTVTFGPGLPEAKQTAIEKLGMGILNKCYLSFPRKFWPDTDWLNYVPPVDKYGQWAQWINVTRANGEPVLLGFNAADFGRTIEGWSDTQIIDSAMQTLKTIFGQNIPEPTGHQITRWASDPYARGSYSYYKVGSTPAMRDQLAASITDRVYFAGEATSSKSSATVHGAYLSGIKAAKEIIA
ncbi:flavin monoamine oxidase family protein [Streptomyces sp. NPDC060232]|uniref:flavin monoamine oxidase family protein n=1 Tax=Streptomyces sp. NPDC060232 TaxID=3347079 RepID=UPI003667AB05